MYVQISTLSRETGGTELHWTWLPQTAKKSCSTEVWREREREGDREIGGGRERKRERGRVREGWVGEMREKGREGERDQPISLHLFIVKDISSGE